MPQLVPFYFVNSIFFAAIIITGLLLILSKYILPNYVRLFISRLYIKNI